jgi:hypothetical protein
MKEDAMHVKHGRRFWRGVGVGGLAVMMALPATAAFGQTAIHHDAAHDVIMMDEMGNPLVAVPRNKTADIVRVRFTHTNRRAVTTMRLRDYGGRWLYNGLIKTPTKKFVVFGRGQHARKHFELWKGIKHPIDVPCDGISSKVDRAKHTFRVSIPTDCLNRPRWVRMGLRYFVHAHDNVYLADDSLGPDFRNLFRMLTARLYTD